MNQKQIITIKLPDFSKIKAAYSQIRPYRKGGVRLECQTMNNKLICHNYGHGGAGVSLAYGSAYIAVKEIMSHRQIKSKVCAIIGSGIIGLMTSIQLAKQGYSVSIYSQKYPQYGQKNNDKCITSQVAPGFWQPYWYYRANIFQHQLLSKLSYDYYLQCMLVRRYTSLRKVIVYDGLISQQQHIKKGVSNQIKSSFKKVNLNFVPGGVTEQYLTYETIQINVQLFLQQLKTQAALRGVKMVTYKFENINDVLKLKEDIIVNCSGYGAKKLFSDSNVVANRGHLLQFDNPCPQKFNYILQHREILYPKTQNVSFDIYCLNHRILLGASVQMGQQQAILDKNVMKRIYETAIHFLNSRTTQSKL